MPRWRHLPSSARLVTTKIRSQLSCDAFVIAIVFYTITFLIWKCCNFQKLLVKRLITHEPHITLACSDSLSPTSSLATLARCSLSLLLCLFSYPLPWGASAAIQLPLPLRTQHSKCGKLNFSQKPTTPTNYAWMRSQGSSNAVHGVEWSGVGALGASECRGEGCGLWGCHAVSGNVAQTVKKRKKKTNKKVENQTKGKSSRAIYSTLEAL